MMEIERFKLKLQSSSTENVVVQFNIETEFAVVVSSFHTNADVDLEQ